MAYILTVISNMEYRGTGTPDDPHRPCDQLWANQELPAHCILDVDDWTGKLRYNGTLYRRVDKNQTPEK